MKRRSLLLTAVLILAACGGAADYVPDASVPLSAPEKGIVFLFPGFTFPFETYVKSGTYVLAQQIRQRGIRAEINYATEWQQVATRFIDSQSPETLPIAVVGYSFGADSAIEFATALGQAGRKVETLVVIETPSPPPIPANVGKAVHIFGGGSTSFGTPIVPGAQFSGSIEELSYPVITHNAEAVDHWQVNVATQVRERILTEVLESDHVRRRSAFQANAK